MSFSAAVHEFHLSKSTINYNTADGSLQITMHIFIDDLEVALAEKGVSKLYIGTEKEDTTADLHISEYIAEHFKLKGDDKSLQPQFLGKELSKDLAAIWCYMEVTLDQELEQMDISHNLLMEVFADQKNVITIKKDKKRADDLLLDLSDFEAKVKL